MAAGELLDTVVVGYGPVGATAANLLGQAGLRAAVFEPTTSVHHLPRAAHLDAEVMRIFQNLGLAESVLPATVPVTGMHFVTGAGEKLFGFDAPAEPTEHGWAAGYMFYQPDLERALRAGVMRFPHVGVHLAHEVIGLAQHPDHVEVTVRDLAAGTTRTVAARWILGCDGARSLVRREAGLALDDLAFDQPWLVVDTLLQREVDLPPRVLQVCDPARPITFVPSAGRHRRWEFMLLPGEDADAMVRPARIAELLAPWVPPGAVEVIRAAVYSFHALVARGWRAQRSFLLGDAAHQMPPFLGQGMCAGVRDAANLVWKLALVGRGRASDALLDTYQREREPHVRAVIGLAVSLGRILQTTDPAVAAARDAQFRDTGAAAAGHGPIAEVRMPPLGEGAHCRPGGADDDPAGRLVPQVRVRAPGGDEARLDDLLGPGFALVAADDPRRGLGAAGLALLEDLGTRFVTIGRAPAALRDQDGRLDAWLARHGAALVRPDRQVFGTAADVAGREPLVGALRAALGAPA